ncbi:MAG: hypothetical protein KF805_15190 [Phycisphaeraceae bacterium]|nr:hypothetical protein [Phycisphaeraceae bacterium]
MRKAVLLHDGFGKRQLDIDFAFANPDQPRPNRRKQPLAIKRLGDAGMERGMERGIG